MNTNAIITNLKARLESEFNQLIDKEIADAPLWKVQLSTSYIKSGRDFATATLIPLLEKAVAMAEQVDKSEWLDESAQHLAREFLASIRERAEGVTMIKDGSER